MNEETRKALIKQRKQAYWMEVADVPDHLSPFEDGEKRITIQTSEETVAIFLSREEMGYVRDTLSSTLDDWHWDPEKEET